MSDHPKMPCLESGFFGFHHTVDSALEILNQLGVSPSRISLRMAGRGYPSRWVVSQVPAPGSELGPGVAVRAGCCGSGILSRFARRHVGQRRRA